MDEIAALTLSSRKTVRRYLMHYQIPLRPQDRLILEPEKFGTRRVNGILRADPKELKAIETLQELRGRGLSYREVVEEMNRLKVPCRKAKAKWHVKTVYKILTEHARSLENTHKTDQPAFSTFQKPLQ